METWGRSNKRWHWLHKDGNSQCQPIVLSHFIKKRASLSRNYKIYRDNTNCEACVDLWEKKDTPTDSLSDIEDEDRVPDNWEDVVKESINKRKKISRGLKLKLWEFYYGLENGKGSCYVCKKEILMAQFEAGHVKSHHDGGDISRPNLRCICHQCNQLMETVNLELYKNWMNQRLKEPSCFDFIWRYFGCVQYL